MHACSRDRYIVPMLPGEPHLFVHKLTRSAAVHAASDPHRRFSARSQVKPVHVSRISRANLKSRCRRCHRDLHASGVLNPPMLCVRSRSMLASSQTSTLKPLSEVRPLSRCRMRTSMRISVSASVQCALFFRSLPDGEDVTEEPTAMPTGPPCPCPPPAPLGRWVGGPGPGPGPCPTTCGTAGAPLAMRPCV